MDTVFATLACYLLVLSPAVVRTEKGDMTITPATTDADSNLTPTTAMLTPSNSTMLHSTVVSNSTEDTTPFTGTSSDNKTFTATTAATTESTSQPPTIMTPLTDSTSLATETPGTRPPTFTALSTPATQTTGGYISTSDTTVLTTANSSHTVNTTSDPLNRTTQAVRLNMSEKNMTILFSVVLGVFAMALVVAMLHKCKQKIQYSHQPLHNTHDTDAFVAADDTLVISGGLYDGHPIYDNVPTASTDQSQFRLEFLH